MEGQLMKAFSHGGGAVPDTDWVDDMRDTAQRMAQIQEQLGLYDLELREW